MEFKFLGCAGKETTVVSGGATIPFASSTDSGTLGVTALGTAVTTPVGLFESSTRHRRL